MPSSTALRQETSEPSATLEILDRCPPAPDPPVATRPRVERPLPATHALPVTASLVLDLVRFSAALLVVAGHLTHAELHTGMRERQVLGAIAVPVFFVLSGFVIRLITRARKHNPRACLRPFLIDRAARIYSVVLPAMLLTLLVTAAVRILDPANFAVHWAGTSDQPALRILLNLTFLSQSWGHNTIPFLNTPFWSLSYECLYYVGFALLLFLRGARRILALLLWALAAGPQVLFLLPVWALGCVAYDAYHWLRSHPLAKSLRSALLILIPVLLALGPDSWPRRLIPWFAALPNPLSLFDQPEMRATMFALGTGLVAGLALPFVLLLSDLVVLAKSNPWPRRFRHVADGTFSLYLMHYPLMVFATALGLYRPHALVRNLLVTGVLCVLLILAARPLDQLKLRLRDWLRHLFPEPNPAPPRRPANAAAAHFLAQSSPAPAAADCSPSENPDQSPGESTLPPQPSVLPGRGQSR